MTRGERAMNRPLRRSHMAGLVATVESDQTFNVEKRDAYRELADLCCEDELALLCKQLSHELLAAKEVLTKAMLHGVSTTELAEAAMAEAAEHQHQDEPAEDQHQDEPASF